MRRDLEEGADAVLDIGGEGIAHLGEEGNDLLGHGSHGAGLGGGEDGLEVLGGELADGGEELTGFRKLHAAGHLGAHELK